ncbi:dolichyl-diphosphooligosaccharide--protein glycosyltransferase subunit 2 [Mesonia aestuariivivens]|uniref:Dolichyl-diphosphooligosaccharide--protein glycosyltransferase subunit 2 n=1 Tax=Mesonia aestuariivivens TaxID=2796128 RepID=A0ABS6W349_9FLAO|nr:dolichyl-diphosphooligosaccharide--protein glycosyltransferase subunit 2 [Mesonia aestuariivivens]MBW2962285.1 dolichyl-diphosphooligosaccharide--protein glycosyltransferase subunit 2 [Mesonia aestuariivivens]
MNLLKFKDWKKKAENLFGENIEDWKFQCPSCKGVQTLKDFKEAKIKDPETKFYFSCIGRWVENKGCKWTLGGLLQIHKTEVINKDGESIPVFEFDNSTVEK